MQNIQVFNFQNKEVRTISRNGEPWFVGKDVCSYFGDTNHNRSLSRLDEEDKSLVYTNTEGGTQEVTAINESGLYQLLFSFQPAKANKGGTHTVSPLISERIAIIKQFKKWVTKDVLPSIRKTGSYQLPTTYKDALKQLVVEIEQKEEAQNTVAILTHVKKLYTSTELAQELGFRSPQAFNKHLKEKGIQYKANGTLVLSANYADLGYQSIKQEVHDNGHVYYDRKWTQRGREFLVKVLDTKAHVISDRL